MAYDSPFLQHSFQRHASSPTTTHELMVTSSPSSPAAVVGGNSPFLPGYLLGETPTATPATPSSGARQGWSYGGAAAAGSHGRLHSHHINSVTAGTSSSNSAGSLAPSSNSLLSAALSHHTSPGFDGRSRDSAGGRGKDKSAAPPVQGLFDTMTVSSPMLPAPSGHMDFVHTDRTPLHTTTNLNRTPAHANHISYSSPAVGHQQTPSLGFGKQQQQPSQLLSPAQVDPFYTQGEALAPGDVLDERWVTVFGFQPAAAAFVLRQFSQYGTILEHVMSGDGNWMHLHYQTKIQARKALSKNGKIIGNNIMVGVTPCIDKVIARADENLDLSVSSTSQNISRHEGARPGGISSLRPLTAAYKSAAMYSEVAPRTQTPKKSTGFLSKAMEYMFGW